MPEVTGVVNDPIRKKSYLVKIAGSEAAKVFAFNMRQKYVRGGVLQLKSVPTIVTSSDAEDIVDAKKGHYILADIEVQDHLCDKGEYRCPILNERFTKQATLFPYDSMTMLVTGYLRNGEMLMSPLHPRRKHHKTLIYPINLIEVGDITDLETPVSLAIYKKQLYDSRSSDQEEPEHINIEPSTSTFQPILDQSGPDDQADATGASAASTASLDSTIISGTLNFGKTTTATRARCGADVERQLNRAVADPANPDFSPWMTSTGTTPPGSRPSSAQSLPADLDSPDDKDSPTRPKSTSPTKIGRRHARRAVKDKTYQPSIKSFLAPSSPTSPVRPRTPLPTRNKRRSQRLPEDAEEEPALKRQAQSPRELDETIQHTVDVEDTSSSSPKEPSVLILKEVTRKQKLAEAANEPPILIDLDNDVTPRDSDRSESTPMDEGVPGPSSGTLTKYREPVRSNTPPAHLVIPTPPISASSSRAGSMTTNRPSSLAASMSPQPSTAPGYPNPYIDPVPGPSCIGHNISLHSNIPMDKDPKHVLIKASKDHVHVKILTFPAYNLADIVKCFFQEGTQTDDPSTSLDETLEEVINSSGSTTSSSIIAMMSKFLASTIQIFTKRDATPINTSFMETEEDEEEEEGEDTGEDKEEGKGNAN